MTKLERLKECAAQGMTSRDAAALVGCQWSYAREAQRRHGFRFAPAKRGRKVGLRKATAQTVAAPDLNLSAIEQMLSDIERLPLAKRNDYRTLRVNHGVPHHVAVAVLQ